MSSAKKGKLQMATNIRMVFWSMKSVFVLSPMTLVNLRRAFEDAHRRTIPSPNSSCMCCFRDCFPSLISVHSVLGELH